MRFSPPIIQRLHRRLAGAHRLVVSHHHTRNLLILHSRTYQAWSDWVTAKEKIEARAPDIDVRIDSNESPDPATYRWQAARPSLVFSPFRLLAYRPPGGTVYAGREIGKIVEWRRLMEAGLPIPKTARLVPGHRFEPAIWGEHVIVKPVKGWQGRGIRLVRTEEVEGRYAELSDDGRARMLVQEYIDHVDAENRPTSYRVLTLFGEPLLQSKRSWVGPRRPIAEIAADPAGRIATNAEEAPRRGELVKIPDVLAFARRVAAAFPEIPCLGQDIVRRTETGKLYILETNPGGSTWHFSSDFAAGPGHDRDYAKARYAQFNALDLVADQLINKTRTEAS